MFPWDAEDRILPGNSMFAQKQTEVLSGTGLQPCPAESLPWFSLGSEAGGGAESRNWIQICLRRLVHPPRTVTQGRHRTFSLISRLGESGLHMCAELPALFSEINQWHLLSKKRQMCN